MTDNKVTLEILNKDPLLAKQPKQSLYLTVTSDGYQKITLSGQLGEGAADLLTVDEFNRLKKNDINLTPSSRSYATMGDPSVQSKSKWLIDITFKAKKPWKIQLQFQNFTASTEGTTKIEVKEQGKNVLLLDPVEVVKATIKPRITSFDTDKDIKAGEFTLSWKIEPESSPFALELYESEKPALRMDKNARSVTRNVAGKTDYTLKLTNGAGKILDERCLRIHAVTENTFKGYRHPSKPAGILGLCAHEGSANLREAFLLALLQDDPSKPSVSLWKTNQGFDADKWVKLPGNIPLDAARRPGIIFKDQLWLIGGDCSDPEPPRAAFNVGSYKLTIVNSTFEDRGREEIGQEEKWPPDRMGHALVKPDEERLWVMGGWAQDGGPRNDIWEFDGREWKELAKADWKPRCLFGATVTSDAVWIAGGFDSPGAGTSYDDIWRYDKKNRNWDQLINTIRPDTKQQDEPQYCACMLFTLYGNPCAIATYKYPTTSLFVHHLRRLKRGVGGWDTERWELSESAAGKFEPREYYRIDSAVFGGTAAFFRYLAGNDKIMGQDITYFVAAFWK